MRMPEGRADPRVRRFLLPTRLLWQSNVGAANAMHVLDSSDSVCTLGPGGALLLDFGRELHGGIRLDCPTTSNGKPVRLRVRFGESASEAMGAPNQDHAIHDHEILLPWMGHTEVGCTGFRFVRLDSLESEATADLRRVEAVALYRDLPYLGSFECSDPLLNRIWETGAYTVHLCMQDHVWDGIKRDRLVWIGDMHPETLVIATVFGDVDVVAASLDYVRDRTPPTEWMNGISSYSLWWILCHHDWYRFHGRRAYLAEQRSYLTALTRRLTSLVDEQGREHLGALRFIEWPTSRDPTAIDAGLQALMVLALEAAAFLCGALGEEAAARDAEQAAMRARRYQRDPTPSKQANALRVLAGQADPRTTNAECLARDPSRGISTFYGLYVLQARAAAGDHVGCLDLLRDYWGGMLRMGATTFWEGFETDWMEGSTPIDVLPEPGKRDIHADFGDYCYVGLRHSLCHGWAAGPTAWLTEQVLGLRPLAPGSTEMRLQPNLAGLEWARGALPTPHGLVKVEHERGADGAIHSTWSAPEGVEIQPVGTRRR